MVHVSHIYSDLLLVTCAGAVRLYWTLGLAVHNSSAAVTSSGKEQKTGKCVDDKCALPNAERSEKMHDSWQLWAGIGGETFTDETLNHKHC